MIGGETVLRALVRDFYRIMDELPEAYGIRKLHPQNLGGSEEKLFMFLSGWMGGPDLFARRFGHPRLRARHLPFAIAESERDQWLMCMREAMALHVKDESLREKLYEALAGLADHMRNQA
jgi:hemoglobin